MKIILASQSPRRKELLEQIGIKDYEIIVSQLEEKMDTGLKIEERAKKSSFQKAKVVLDKTEGDRIVIGADTVVEKDEKIYGKPKDRAEARAMLRELKNSKVSVITAMTVLIQKKKEIIEKIDSIVTEVYIKDMTEKEIEEWINTGKAMDKAGAFSIQEEFSVYIEKIVGDYNGAMGLSTSKLYDRIKEYIR